MSRFKEDEIRCVPVPLTVDHNPSVYAERMRIQKAGGNVRYAFDLNLIHPKCHRKVCGLKDCK